MCVFSADCRKVGKEERLKKTTEQMILEQMQKYEELAQLHQKMKEVNQYYRRNLIMGGCPHPEIVPHWKYEREHLHPATWVPFSRLEMQNNLRKMQRIKERLAFLRERAAEEQESAGNREAKMGRRPASEPEREECDILGFRDRPSVREKLQRNTETLKADLAAEEVVV